MTDQAADVLVENHGGVDIWRRQYDPYGGPTNYFYVYRGRQSPMYSDPGTLKKDLDIEIDKDLTAKK